MSNKSSFSIDDHFIGKDANVRETYDMLLKSVRAFGPVIEDPKKTSIHLNRNTAFAGVATRKSLLVLTIKADNMIESERIFKSEKVSANRYHLEIKVSAPAEIDQQLIAWLKDAYELCA